MNAAQHSKDERMTTVLVVEDHKSVRDSLCKLIGAAFPRLNLLQAETGEDAVEMAIAESPDLILMDIGLPGISGIEACRKIKAARPEVEVVMLTIHENLEYQLDAKAAGACRYMVKRRVMNELIPVLREFLPSGENNNRF